jgi:NAD/NADP transhydrogenase beta subunit
MTSLIIFFGLLTFITGIIIVFNPEIIFGVLRNNYEKVSLHILAVVIRLLIGVLLIVYAGESKHPMVIEIIGWLSIAAAATFAIMGRQNFIRLMSWAFDLLKPFGRIGGVFAVVFGGFLVYAFI